MNRSIRPRLQTPLKMIAGGLVATAIAVAVYGWVAWAVLAPIALIAAAGYYMWGGRDSDVGALIGHKADERQATLQLKMQALAGKVMSVAAVVAYFVAFAAKATLWPFAIFIALPAVTLFAGWVIYHDHRGDQDTDSHPGRDPMPTH
jgi:hypothetical protein